MKRFYGLAGGLALAGTASAALLLSDATTTGGTGGSTSAIANWVSLGSPLQATTEEPMAAALAASISVQQWDCWVIRQFYFQFFKESPHCSP